MYAAVFNLTGPNTYVHFGFVSISLSNLLVIVAMLVLFALALALPFIHPKAHGQHGSQGRAEPGGAPAQPGGAPAQPAGAVEAPATTWTGAVRKIGLRFLPPEKLLPETQPAYVSSWVYIFGVLTLSGLGVAIASGLVLAIEGPTWWHISSVGLFVNSLHLWSVELFMAFMTIHLWGKFWMAAWRGRRAATWATGVIAFLISIVEAFTGYLSQTNFDSQWIAFESKDAFNASGAGAIFDAMNFGQALMLHIVFLPLVLVAIVAVHVLLVRVRGVVHPLHSDPDDLDVPTAGHPTPSSPPSSTPSTVPGDGAPAGARDVEQVGS
ncbi:MAG: cytochrome b N-terminal domain-containing protein [Acidimicrobiales bacterium]